jgi:membrane-associated phospholipid phosphatase
MSHNGIVQERSGQQRVGRSGFGAAREAGSPHTSEQRGAAYADPVQRRPAGNSATTARPWFDSSARLTQQSQAAWGRWSEAVMIAYFLYAAAMSAVLPVESSVTAFTIGLNLTLVGVFVTLAYLGRTRPSSTAVSMARDWFPLAVLVLAYREMGWFAPQQHIVALENGWIVWDRLLLSDWGVQAAVEALGPALPALLELCYSLVYAIGPFCLAALYWWGCRDRADAFLFRFLLGTVLSYALFPYFPSEPPRTVFPGDNLPTYDTIFRQFNWWLLGGHGIHTSVFPSAHVSSAFAGAFALFRVVPERKWAGWVVTLLATGIFWATIYGRYHYAVDAVAGLLVAIVALLLCEWVEQRLAVESRMRQNPKPRRGETN